MKLRHQYTCPLELAHDCIRGKWKPIILWQLGKGERSLSQLKREIGGITQKMLLEQLKELAACGIVDKNSSAGYPLRVAYFLTARGRKLVEAIGVLQGVGVEMMLEDGREGFLRERGLL